MASKNTQMKTTKLPDEMSSLSQNFVFHDEESTIQDSITSLNESTMHLVLNDQIDQSSNPNLNPEQNMNSVSEDETQNKGSYQLDEVFDSTIHPNLCGEKGHVVGISIGPQSQNVVHSVIRDQPRIRGAHRPHLSPIGHHKTPQDTASQSQKSSPNKTLFDMMTNMNVSSGSACMPVDRKAPESTIQAERPSQLSSQNILGSLRTPRHGPTLFGHIINTLQHAQAGPNIGHHNRYALSPSNSQRGRQPGSLAVPPPQILEMMAAEINMIQQTEELLALGDDNANVSTGLSDEAIMTNLGKKNYHCQDTNDLHTSTEMCPICKETYLHGESIGKLDCNHEFHTHCIKVWLKRKNECPICKMKGLNA